jgi:hypothetical protein
MCMVSYVKQMITAKENTPYEHHTPTETHTLKENKNSDTNVR